MRHHERPNRFACIAGLALLLIVLTPSSGPFTAPALLFIAMVLVVFALASSARRGRT